MAKSQPELTEMVHVRMSRRDVRRLSALMRHYERNASDVLRRLIAEASSRLTVEPKKET